MAGWVPGETSWDSGSRALDLGGFTERAVGAFAGVKVKVNIDEAGPGGKGCAGASDPGQFISEIKVKVNAEAAGAGDNGYTGASDLGGLSGYAAGALVGVKVKDTEEAKDGGNSCARASDLGGLVPGVEVKVKTNEAGPGGNICVDLDAFEGYAAGAFKEFWSARVGEVVEANVAAKGVLGVEPRWL